MAEQSLLQNFPIRVGKRFTALQNSADTEDIIDTSEYILDSLHELEYSPKLFANLVAATREWNIIYVHFHISSVLFKPYVHPLLCGQNLLAAPPFIKNMARDAGSFLARYVVSEFMDKYSSINA